MKLFILFLIVLFSVEAKMDKKLLKEKLNPLEYEVICNEATEPPFQNEYWNHKAEGIYVDKVSGEALFSSNDKFDSGTGWPSFTKPINESQLITKTDLKLLLPRTEVRAKKSDAHLGHVFNDGPKDKGGMRYCINSASLKFIPLKELDAQGYGEYKSLFEGGFSAKYEEVILGGGCFWGVEELLRSFPGVIQTDVGYAGGKSKNPNYNEVKHGTTGHAEVVHIKYDPSKTTLDKIYDFFFKLHDPTTKNRQGNDIGTQYRSVIFYKNENQKKEALDAIARAEKSGRWKSPIVTELVLWPEFTKAEEYHQDYLQKNPNGYTCHWIRE